MEDTKTLSLVVLGSVAVVAVLGLVMLFNSEDISGAALYAGNERADLARGFTASDWDKDLGAGSRRPIGECLVKTAGEFTNVKPIFSCQEWDAYKDVARANVNECRLFAGNSC